MFKTKKKASGKLREREGGGRLKTGKEGLKGGGRNSTAKELHGPIYFANNVFRLSNIFDFTKLPESSEGPHSQTTLIFSGIPVP